MSLVQYIVLRKDLQTVLNWPLGALLAQACHASTAVLHLFKDDPNSVEYLANLDNMHKVVLQAPDLDSLTALAQKLSENKIDHKLWIEQPENIPTCIAIKPYAKNDERGAILIYYVLLSRLGEDAFGFYSHIEKWIGLIHTGSALNIFQSNVVTGKIATGQKVIEIF